jgi:prolyl oligopeptidase
VLESACAVNGNQMIVSYLSDVKYVLQTRDLKSGSFLHQLPIDIGTVSGITARRKDSTWFLLVLLAFLPLASYISVI